MNIETQTEGHLYGQSQSEWRDIYEKVEWKRTLTEACCDIASCVHADVTDREVSTKILGKLVEDGHIPARLPNGRTVAELTCAIQMEVLGGHVLKVNKALREQCSERARVARWCVGTVLPAYFDPTTAQIPPQLRELLGMGIGGGGPEGSGSSN